MSKSMIIAAAVSALVIATPAFAQNSGKPAGPSAGFGGVNGSATNLRDAPRPGDETRSTGFGGRKAGGGGGNREDIKREIRNSGVVEPRQTRESAARTKATNNMKQIGLANH